jgi:hypothetical protein
MATNPLLAEINNLSPGAKAALASAHQAASQATAPPPLVPNSTAPKLGPAVGPKAPMPDTGPPPTPAGLSPPNSGPMPAAIATPGPSEAPPSIKAPPGTIPADTAELARKESTGSGISQIHGMIENSRLGQAHPLLGKILGWGAQIPAELGDIAGSAVAPQVTRLIPGTEYHHDVLVKQGQRQVAGDVENAQKQAQTQEAGAATQKTQEETAEMPEATAEKKALNDAQIMNYLHPQAKTSFEAWRQQNPSAPVADFFQAQQDAKPTKEPGGPKTIQKEVGGRPHTFAYDETTKDYTKDEGETGEKPPVVNVNAPTAALDRETKQFGSGHQKALDGAQSQLEKIADARSMINGNAEAQGLGIPKVLTALVGGQGTGVRITQAELQSIAHARGIQGDFEGTLNKLSGKGALSAAQQQQLTQILDDVKNRIQQKAQIHSDTLDTINGAGSREEIIKADKDARKKLSDMESGGGAPSGGSSGKAVSLKAAMGLPVNKGKSEADVRKDIESHGHQVGP